MVDCAFAHADRDMDRWIEGLIKCVRSELLVNDIHGWDDVRKPWRILALTREEVRSVIEHLREVSIVQLSEGG